MARASAGGLPAESYLDLGNRSAFENGGPSVDLHPDFARAVWDAQACGQMIMGGPELISVRATLLRRALLLGYALTTDAALAVDVGGHVIAPRQAEGGYFVFDLPARTRSIRLLSRSAVPGHIRVADDDHRCLGVAVLRLELDEERVALTDARLGDGWLPPEDDMRWTDGNATIAVEGARCLRLRMRPSVFYWSNRKVPLELEMAHSVVSRLAV